MNGPIQKQLTLDAIAKFTQDCDQEVARLRWQLLADRVRKESKAA